MSAAPVPAAAHAVEGASHLIQLALTPVFLLSGVASLLGVFSGRLARVSEQVDDLSDRLAKAPAADRDRMRSRLSSLTLRSLLLDWAVVLGAVAGACASVSAITLFVGEAVRGLPGWLPYGGFAVALVSTVGALGAYMIEMLLSSRRLREEAARFAPVRRRGVRPPDAPPS